MKCLYKLIFGTVLALNLNNNSMAVQFGDFKIDMLGSMNNLFTFSVHNNDYTQSKVNYLVQY